MLILILSGAKAQINEEPEKAIDFFTRLDIAYIIGGQIYNDNFLYNESAKYLHKADKVISFSDANTVSIHLSFSSPTGVQTIGVLARAGLEASGSDGQMALEAG